MALTGTCITYTVKEAGRTPPPFPFIFFKPNTTVLDHDAPVVIPKIAQDDQADYEGELVSVSSLSRFFPSLCLSEGANMGMLMLMGRDQSSASSWDETPRTFRERTPSTTLRRTRREMTCRRANCSEIRSWRVVCHNGGSQRDSTRSRPWVRVWCRPRWSVIRRSCISRPLSTARRGRMRACRICASIAPI